jgi:hypothetical protein
MIGSVKLKRVLNACLKAMAKCHTSEDKKLG